MDVIKEYMYENPMCLMLSWWKRNLFYNTYFISKYATHTIRSDFGNSVSYGSICRSRCIRYNTFTYPRRGKIVNVNPIQGPFLKNGIHFHKKRDSFNFVPQILADNIINDPTKKYFLLPGYLIPSFLNFF